MSLNLLKWTASGVLALSVCALAVSSSLSADDKDKEKEEERKAVLAARTDVLKLANGGGGDPQAVAKKHMIEHVMRGFKLREKGGIGLGEKPEAITPDGIEAKILLWATKKLPTKQDLSKDSAAYVKGIEIVKTIADINEFYAPKEKKGDKDPVKWKKFNEDMKVASKSLIEALKATDPGKVKIAAGKLNQSCNDCHGIFRDDITP